MILIPSMPLVMNSSSTTMSQRYRESQESPVASWQVVFFLIDLVSPMIVPTIVQHILNMSSHFICNGLLFFLTENLFGNYLEKGVILEKRGIASNVDPDSPSTTSNRYVLADITSFFTLLVGIYFPSVTGWDYIVN